jgi:hypothetical protein
MPISVQCNTCGKSLKVPDTAAGKRGKCPCGAVLVIPAVAGAIQPLPSAPAPAGRRTPAARGPAGYPNIAHESAGPVTPPATFEKLFRVYLIMFGVVFGLAILVGILFIVGLFSIGSEAQSTFMVVGSSLDGKTMPPINDYRPSSSSSSSAGIMAGLFLVSILLLVAAAIAQTVVMLMFLYKAWNLIQDGNARTTPGKAVGFLFIPFFNIYWMFVAFWGLALDLNGYAQQRGISARAAAAGLMMAALILELCSVIPVVGPILSLVSLVLMLIALNSVKNACVDIATAKIG